MRRMYSEQELTNVIKKVFEEELESGALDELVSDAVDAYLVEHPVDVTALEGQTINPARIDVANINGESNPSVKPIYYHGITCDDANGTRSVVTLTILNNSNEAINTGAKIKSWIGDIVDVASSIVVALNGTLTLNDEKTLVAGMYCDASLYPLDKVVIFGSTPSTGAKKSFEATFTDLFGELATIVDRTNKIN